MDRYEQISVVGEGSYGVVLKCRHKESDQIVAIKKFLETEEDAAVRRMALREIRMLKKLRHENLVTMIEVFRHRKRFYLVFEYLGGTVLDELERSAPNGLGDEKCRERIYQVIRAVAYCHSNNIIHRDVKPENVLISSMGVVKLCDFGFARVMLSAGEPCTEYVATRWYRAPELLVGEQNYTSAVDVWAIGCLFAEMMTGEPLFPGESDIDQLYLIAKSVGRPCARHQSMMARNSQLRNMIMKGHSGEHAAGLYKTFASWSLMSLEFLISCLRMDPNTRSTSDDLLRHAYFQHDKFPAKFLPALREKVNAEFNGNPLLRKYKPEILASTDQHHQKSDRVVYRRSYQQEGVPRWKMQIVGTKGAKTYREKTGLTFLKSVKHGDNTSGCFKDSEMQILQKGMEDLHVDGNELLANRRKSPERTLLPMPVAMKNLPPVHNSSEEMFINIEPLHLAYSSLSVANKRKDGKVKDEFSLPNLPGAMSSPQGKNSISESSNAVTPTPEYRYRKAKRKYPL